MRLCFRYIILFRSFSIYRRRHIVIERINKKLNRLNDFLFKQYMGTEDCKECLLSFLNAVLNDTIEDIELLKNLELPKETLEGKFGRLDIRAKLTNRTVINIEVQLLNEDNIVERSQYYNSRLYVGSIKKGEDYRLLSKVISINILNFSYFPYKEFYISGHLRVDQYPEDILSDRQEYHFIELPKFYSHETHDKTNPLHRWLIYFNQNVEKEELEELMSMDQAIKTAEEKVKKILSSEEQRRYYEAIEDARRNMVSSMRYNREKGKEEGIKEGKKEGKKEGEIRTIELMKLLLQENRKNDMQQALQDDKFREALFKEYNL